MPSQLGQDVLVLQILGQLRNGFFLDSGASDGVTVSNTLLLEKSFGWKGICIEPNEHFFAALIKNRSCNCINCCLYNHTGTVDFVEASTLGGIVNEYPPALLNFAKNALHLPEDAAGKPLTVPKASRTLLSVLEEFNAPSIIDYWSLDTEGSELTILKSFPFDRYSFRVLTVEHNHMPVKEEIRQFLEGYDYVRIRELGIDDCYVKKALLPNTSWRSNVWRKFK